jgi:hypothetical protein
MSNAEKVLARYKELEALAYESIGIGRNFYPEEIQNRIRTLAIIRDVMEEAEND